MKIGVQEGTFCNVPWIPAFAGMTVWESCQVQRLCRSHFGFGLGLEPSTSPIAIGALSRLSYSPTDDAVVLGALSRLSYSPKERTRAGALFQYSKRAVYPQLLKAAL